MTFRELNRPLRLLPIALGLAVLTALPASARTSASTRPSPTAALLAQNACAHTQASQVNAIVAESKDAKTCGTGLVILGAQIGFGGERCPSWRLTHPSHQICSGNTLDDHFCASAGNLDVIMETCSCERYTIPLLEIGIASPVCGCTTMSAGHIEDFETRPCPTDSNPTGPGS